MSHYSNFTSYGMPNLVVDILLDFNSWLVGSMVQYHFDELDDRPKDVDVIVDPRQWSQVMRRVRDLVNSGTDVVNFYGGLKLSVDGVMVDIWPSTVEDYFLMGGSKTPIHAYNLQEDIRLQRTN